MIPTQAFSNAISTCSSPTPHRIHYVATNGNAKGQVPQFDYPILAPHDLWDGRVRISVSTCHVLNFISCTKIYLFDKTQAQGLKHLIGKHDIVCKSSGRQYWLSASNTGYYRWEDKIHLPHSIPDVDGMVSADSLRLGVRPESWNRIIIIVHTDCSRRLVGERYAPQSFQLKKKKKKNSLVTLTDRTELNREEGKGKRSWYTLPLY